MSMNWTSRLARPLARFFQPAEIMPAEFVDRDAERVRRELESDSDSIPSPCVAPQRARRPLLVGLSGYGFSMAVMVRAGLGLDPWDVFHQGLPVTPA